jgi:hypothetical protein
MLSGGRTLGNISHSTALGWAVKLAGYTAHPQNMASLLLALAQQNNPPQNSKFRGIHADFLLEGKGTVRRGNTEYQCGNLSQCRTHVRCYVRDLKWYEKFILERSIGV